MSRELFVSRPTIYKKIAELGIEKKTEYPLDEYETIKKELMTLSSAAKKKKADAAGIEKTATAAAAAMATKEARQNVNAVSKDEKSTLSQRLQNAKQEYNYNRELIVSFQTETQIYVREFGKTTIATHNGVMAPIPSISNLEKYIKLNIALSKLISDLEGDLDLTADEGENPFG
jgi:hypothetical protein